MEIRKLKNNLSRQRGRGVVLYHGCCCCSSCCILTPAGVLAAEYIVQGVYNPKEKKVGLAFFVNMGCMLASGALAWVLTQVSRSFLPGTILGPIAYWLALYGGSIVWLTTENKKERISAVSFQFFLSLFLGGLFFLASLVIGFFVVPR